MKKLLTGLLLILASFSFFACKKNNLNAKELEPDKIMNKAYLKKAFEKQSISEIKKFEFETTNLKRLTSGGGFKTIVYRTVGLKDSENKDCDKVILLTTKGELKPLKDYIYKSADTIVANDQYVYIKTKKDDYFKTNYIYSINTAERLFELPEQVDDVSYTYYFDASSIKSINTKTNTTKKYYFKDGELISELNKTIESDFSNDFSIYNYYIDNKLYDQINLLTNVEKKAFELANKDILFQQIEEVKKEDKKISELDFNYRVAGYTSQLFKYRHFLYSYKDKTLTEVTLPYLIKTLLPNTINPNIKLKKYNDIIENIAKIKPINQETKFQIDEDESYVNLSNKLEIQHRIKNSATVCYSAENKYFLYYRSIKNIYRLTGEKEQVIDGSLVLANINNTHLLLKDPSKIVPTGFNSLVSIYDLINNKISEQYEYIKNVYGSYLNGFILRDVKNNKYYLLNGLGELQELKGTFQEILADRVIRTQDENKTYFYNLSGQLIGEYDKDMEFQKHQSQFDYTSVFSSPTTLTYNFFVSLVFKKGDEEVREVFYYSFHKSRLIRDVNFY